MRNLYWESPVVNKDNLLEVSIVSWLVHNRSHSAKMILDKSDIPDMFTWLLETHVIDEKVQASDLLVYVGLVVHWKS